MNFREHCDLCDNLKISLKDGIVCGLTSLKPKFNKTCSKIELNDKFEKKLGLINIEVERIKQEKNSTHLTFYTFIIIGFILIIGGSLLVKFALTSIYTFQITSIIIGAGLTFLGIAYKKLNKYRRKAKIAKAKKSKIDKILNQYQIKYNTDIKFGKKYHGIQEAVVELKIENGKHSTTTYKINEA